MKKLLLLLAIFLYMISCKDTTEKKIIQEKKIVQLKGHYNIKEDIWENPDPNFSERINFEKLFYATFYKFDKDENILGIGVIDKKGKVIVQPIYESVTLEDSLQNGIFQVGNKQDKYGLVNEENGVEIMKPQFDFIYLGKDMSSLERKLGIIQVSKKEKKGYINKKGKIVIPLKYYNLFLMGEDLIMFEKTFPDNNHEGSIFTRWGIMDFNQNVIVDAIFGYPDKFKNGKVTLIVAGKDYIENGKTYGTPGQAYTFFKDGRLEKQ